MCWHSSIRRRRVIKPLWGAALAANVSGPLAIRLQASFPQRPCGKTVGDQLAGRSRPPLPRWAIRLQASFPQRPCGKTVGDQLAGKSRPPCRVGPFACKQVSHSGLVVRLWKTSLLANSGLRRCPIRLQASPPHSVFVVVGNWFRGKWRQLAGTTKGPAACATRPLSVRPVPGWGSVT